MKIINKAPNSDLVSGVTDEFALQMKYETLDQILYSFEKDMSDRAIENEIECDIIEANYKNHCKRGKRK